MSGSFCYSLPLNGAYKLSWRLHFSDWEFYLFESWDLLTFRVPAIANIVLQSTIERIFVPPTEEDENARGLYADIPLGIFLVRGENVLLLGELDLDKDDEPPAGYDQADLDLVKRLAKERKNEAKTKHKSRVSRLGKIGFEGENMGEILF